MQNETKKVYSKPAVAEIGSLSTFVNANNESSNTDGAPAITYPPPVGMVLPTQKFS